LWSAAAWFAWGLYFFWQGDRTGFGFLCVAIGALVVGTGWPRVAHARAFGAESARARHEWNELRDGAAAAKRVGNSVERFVRERGYQVEGVVRWVVHDLENEIKGE
jgi:hypothetical protein